MNAAIIVDASYPTWVPKAQEAFLLFAYCFTRERLESIPLGSGISSVMIFHDSPISRIARKSVG